MEAHLHVPRGLPARLPPRPAAHPESWAVQLRWFGIAAVAGFAVPFVGSSVLDLHHDLYLGLYFAIVLSLFGAYAAATQLDVRATLTRHWKLGVAFGVVF